MNISLTGSEKICAEISEKNFKKRRQGKMRLAENVHFRISLFETLKTVCKRRRKNMKGLTKEFNPKKFLRYY